MGTLIESDPENYRDKEELRFGVNLWISYLGLMSETPETTNTMLNEEFAWR
jgi:hypothetical protein